APAMLGSASMMATAPCAPTVIPYSRTLGPLGFAGEAARPGSENRTAGGVRSWEKMFAATMASYLGVGGVLTGAASGWASAGTSTGAARARGRDVDARRSPKPATRSAPAATYRLRPGVTSRWLRPPRGRVRAGGATK